MRRRTLLVGSAASAMLAALPARAQQTRRSAPYRIGLLPAFDEIPGYQRDLAALFLELGWRQGAEFEFVHTGARYSSAELDSAARGMVAQRPDLILAVGTSYIVAAHRLTKTIPIVMLASGYPVEAGVAHSLARPGKNVTGNTIYAGTGVWGKFLELLREATPGAKRVGMLMSYVPPGHSLEEIEPVYREVRQAAEVLGFQLQIVEIPGPDRVHAVLAQIEGQRPEALLLTSGQGVWTVRDIAMKFALKHRLPTVADFWWEGIEFPPLLVYAPDFPTLWRPALSYVVRILRDGEKPGELPIQQPAKFELGVSLKTAKAIGLELPRSLLLRADKVIE